jgi:hypothetical protein
MQGKEQPLASVLERPLRDGYLEGRVKKHRRGYAVDSGQSVYHRRPLLVLVASRALALRLFLFGYFLFEPAKRK